MKKIYSLFAIVVLAANLSAQGAETFETQTVLTSSYADGSFSGETAGVTVSFQASRDQDAYAINGKGLMLRRADDASFVQFVIPNGVGTFSFKYRKAFTGGSDRFLAVSIDGVETTVTPTFGSGSGEQTNVYSSTTAVNKPGSVTIRISYPAGTTNGSRQITVDDVSWTKNSLAVSDLSSAKFKLVKNTNVSNSIIFSGKSDIQILNMAGQVVKTASVSENTPLNVTSLSKGIYIVTGLVDGQKVSQKIMKN